MPRQVFGHVCVACVDLFDIDGIELVVRLLPAFAQKGKPGSGDSEKVVLVIKPDRLGLVGESGDRVVGDVDLLAVVFQRDIGQALEPRFAGRKQMDRCTMGFFERRNEERKFGCGSVVADVKASCRSLSVLGSAFPVGDAVFDLEVLVDRRLQVVVAGFVDL